MQRALLAVVLMAVVSGCTPNHDASFQRLHSDQDCAIYFLRSDAEPSAFNLRHGSFCLKDKDQIDRLIREWKFTGEHEPTACGFEYVVYVLENRTPVAQLSLNGPCGYAVIDNGCFDFDTLHYQAITDANIEHLDRRASDSLRVALNAQFGP